MKLEIKDLCHAYADKVVLDNASFTFEKGKIYGLLGRNGAGKTTLFNCINEDITANSGTCSLIDESENKRKIGSDDIGYVVSTPIVPEFLTGKEFVKFFIDVNKKSIADNLVIDDYFEMIQMNEEDRNRLIRDYSHGMKNKVQMLVNFILKPPVLLLDEPLTSLDVVVADEMKNLLRSIKSEHIIILSTHVMDIALDLCDEIVILNEKSLSLIDKSDLDNTVFKDKIINALRGED